MTTVAQMPDLLKLDKHMTRQIESKNKTQNTKISPIWCLGAVEIILPVAHPVLLVKAGVVGTHMRNPSSFRITHMKNLAIVFHICIKTNGSVRAVECKSCILYIHPSFMNFMAITF